MKTNLLKSIFISLILVMGVSNAWAINQSNVDLYFDNSTSKWTNCYVYIGHDSYTSCYAMTRVSGTQYLWKLAKGFNNGSAWNNASGWVVSNEKWWDSESGDNGNIYKFVYHGSKNVTDIRTSTWAASTIYKADGTQSVTHWNTTCTVYKWSTSTKSDYTVTINSPTGGTLTVKDYDNTIVTNGTKKVKLTVLKFSASASTGYTFGGVQINNGNTTTTIAAADIASKTYILTSNVTITPIWTEKTYSVTISAGNGGTVSPSGSKTIGQVTKTTVTATPNANYEFVNWTATGGVVVANTTAASTTITATAAGTLKANFRSTATHSLTVLAGDGINTVGGSTDPVTLGSLCNITATPKTGYTFSTWTANPAANATFGSATTANTTVTVKNGSVTVTATATENMSTLTTSNKYDAGDPGYEVPNASVNSIGYETTATVTATAAGNGYTFTGWTLTNCTRTDGGVDNATSITVRSNGDGKAATVVANYAEDLTTSWVLKGSFVDDFKTAYDFVKKSGESTGTVAYVTLELAANTAYRFKVVNGSTWYGNNNSGTQYWIKATAENWNFYSDAGDCHMQSSVAGTYTFKIDFSGTSPKVSVYFPTAYTLTYGSGAGGSGTVTADNSIKSGDLVLAGTSVTLTADPADGYDFAAWYSDQACEGDVVSSNNPYTFSINSNTTLYAKWKAQSFTLTWELDGGRITEEGTQAGPVAVGTTLVAPTVEKDYCDFAGWNPTVPETMPAADVTYTAQWTSKKYDITYRDQGDKEFSGTHANGYPTTHTYNTTTTLLGATKSGYTFAGWYRDSECAGERVETLGEDVTEAITLYAKWDVASYTINFDLEGGTGGTTTELTVPFGAQLPDITIPTKAGYLFLGYYNGDNGTGTQYYDASGKGLNTMPANNLTLYAKWLNSSDCIFFYNNLGWNNVYVYFYSSDKYWDDNNGTGSQKEKIFSQDGDADHKPHYLEYRGKMTKIEGTNIWYYNRSVHGDITRENYTTVAFTKDQQNNYEFFYETEVVRRSDFNSNVPMFVSMKVNKVTKNNNKTSYYNTGYWMNYPTNTGYKLHIFDKNGNKINDQLVDIPFEYGDNTIMPWSVSVSLEGATTYAFKIQRADGTNDGNGTWYGNNGTMTTNSSGNTGQTAWEFTTGTNNCKITTTAPGTYVFTLNYGKDAHNNYNYLVGVEYPASVGDYRLVYKDDTHPFHPGHLLKKRDGKDTVSFFVHHDQDLHPVIMLQEVTEIDAQTGDITWNTISTTENLNGISATGIYNFILEQSGNAATLQNTITEYDGDFYIRTDATAGGWGNFRQKSNKMTYTSYAENQDFNFNHYFVEWINAGTNVKFTIANDYSYCLSDTLDADEIVTTGNLPANANVRFGWNSTTNELSRAYIAGSSKASDRFLVLTGNEDLKDIAGESIPVGTGDRAGLEEHELIFSDKQNWIYQLDVRANNKTEITLTAKYNNKVQTFLGTSKSGFGGEPIMQATNEDYHKVRMIYDFKTNNLIAAWLLDYPVQETEATSVASNMLIIREDQDDANQINFANGDMQINTAYAVMTFTKEWVTGATTRDRSEYWVSFPFDVNISDVFGFSEYGDQWIMQLYDGAERAEKGNWVDSPTFWKYITNRNYTLKAGVGYVLKLNPSRMTFDHGVNDVSLFFPSQGIPTVINAEPTSITVPPHECTIERDNRNIHDSHWNLIGVPGYANLNDVNTKYTTGNQAENVSFYYAYNAAENKYAPAAAEANFKNMYAYMVQFAGTIDWKSAPQFNNIPQQLAARRNSDTEPEKRTLRLEIAQGEEVADQTFIQLQQEGATAEFDMNLDLTKIINSGANIYTLAGEQRIQSAGNALPMGEVIVPVGVKIDAEGEYTFRMPDGTDGMVVELIDYERDITTNLLLFDYTVTLPAGSNESRFALHIQPNKSGVTTGVENVGDEAKGIEKYLIDGKLMIRTAEGVIYDAQGHVVQ